MTEPEHLLTVTPLHTPAGPFVLEVTGELDHHSAPLLAQAVKEAPFDSHGVIIDLSGLAYCDSTGITVLLTAYQRSQAAGSPLSFAGVHPDQMRVFQVVGLDQVFTFHATAQEAVSALQR
ncbi:STAS domain-containing protein [Streptomyces hirsutus]|uniref:Anti-sigma factor antagonist n=1 Tax=Streptomyces hirsutus TaxID=35620 RepID=A0ABZ1GE59_9ACTN|nr:STAS domain-containing protein [Streptomyces hirsutus]WSD04423.1 STAS domain-containing protein [Streptomyces hirsutus]WTD22190.1 STAS domain-containing protein [Streptomyces hirsutus]WTD72738.1 STAS domain-containing protein [Streptomyces sp. NBC_01635]